jgi:hypothetical protein
MHGLFIGPPSNPDLGLEIWKLKPQNHHTLAQSGQALGNNTLGFGVKNVSFV